MHYVHPAKANSYSDALHDPVPTWTHEFEAVKLTAQAVNTFANISRFAGFLVTHSGQLCTEYGRYTPWLADTDCCFVVIGLVGRQSHSPLLQLKIDPVPQTGLPSLLAPTIRQRIFINIRGQHGIQKNIYTHPWYCWHNVSHCCLCGIVELTVTQ